MCACGLKRGGEWGGGGDETVGMARMQRSGETEEAVRIEWEGAMGYGEQK